MTPWLARDDITVYHGDCVAVMRELPADSVDAIVTDPPYGLGFMGKAWDGPAIERAAREDASRRRDVGPHSDSRPGRTTPRSSSAFGPAAGQAGAYDFSLTGNHAFQSWCETWAREALRVLKPGGHLLAFGGTRTYHRMACAIEDAGFEIRDSLHWLYGSGFPKSLDVSKAIDREAGAEREVVGANPNHRDTKTYRQVDDVMGAATGAANITAPATPEAAAWQGWGTALKPAHEPIVVARKPLAERTVARQVLATGTGALNVDGCRVAGDVPSVPQPDFTQVSGRSTRLDAHARNGEMSSAPGGRWPPNLLLTHSPDCEEPWKDSGSGAPSADGLPTTVAGMEPATTATPRSTSGACASGCPVGELDRQSGTLTSGAMLAGTRPKGERNTYGQDAASGYETQRDTYADTGGASRFFPTFRYEAKASGADRGEGNTHPTVKPVALMRWLVKLVTPPGGVVLDPFAGSGTTLLAARHEGFNAIGIEMTEEYLPIIATRLRQPVQIGLFT